ncbi:hypothetical protein [Pseudomonas sp. RIT-PI-S]|uniref:hypothetical protein n=1 Tax=Pseudomonas sp. RIT-PI-S TaxID=3035295 RepID=UPI0021D9545A|nr:hypothetical protein [Pseudomonas sp. RIT-PI-S]
MAISVKKLEGEQIPEDLRNSGAEQAFAVTEDDGTVHLTDSDEAAAKLAVKLSDPSRSTQDAEH